MSNRGSTGRGPRPLTSEPAPTAAMHVISRSSLRTGASRAPCALHVCSEGPSTHTLFPFNTGKASPRPALQTSSWHPSLLSSAPKRAWRRAEGEPARQLSPATGTRVHSATLPWHPRAVPGCPQLWVQGQLPRSHTPPTSEADPCWEQRDSGILSGGNAWGAPKYWAQRTSILKCEKRGDQRGDGRHSRH